MQGSQRRQSWKGETNTRSNVVQMSTDLAIVLNHDVNNSNEKRLEARAVRRFKDYED